MFGACFYNQGRYINKIIDMREMVDIFGLKKDKLSFHIFYVSKSQNMHHLLNKFHPLAHSVFLILMIFR